MANEIRPRREPSTSRIRKTVAPTPPPVGRPSWSSPISPPTLVNGMIRPVDPVSTSKG